MRSEAFRVTDATRLVERRKTGDELTSVIVCISQVIFGAKKGLKTSGCTLRMLETMNCGRSGAEFRGHHIVDDMNRWIMGKKFRVHYTDKRLMGLRAYY